MAGASTSGFDSLDETLNDLKDDWGESTGVAYVIGTSVSYGIIIEYGSSPHTITPDDAETLKFSVGGTTVYTDRVNHPGTDPYPFLRPALDRAKNQAPAIAKQSTSLDDFVRRLALFVEAEAKKILVSNGNVDTGRLLSSIEARRVA